MMTLFSERIAGLLAVGSNGRNGGKCEGAHTRANGREIDWRQAECEEFLAPGVLCGSGMQKIPALLLAVFFTLSLQAEDSIKLSLLDTHSQAVVTYLEASEVEGTRGATFAAFPRSDDLLAALVSYARLMELKISLKTENTRSFRNTIAGGAEAYRREKGEAKPFLEPIVRDDLTPGPLVYSPRHPDSDSKGMLRLTNVNVRRELEAAKEAKEAKIRHRIVTRAIKHLEPDFIPTVYPLEGDSLNDVIAVELFRRDVSKASTN